MIRPVLTRATLAVAALTVPLAAWSQNNVTVYGLIDMSVGQFQTAGAQSMKAALSGNMSTSYLGFSGSEDLGGDLSATFALESFFRANNGNSGRFDGDTYFARNSNVGLKGAYGAVKFGRITTPLFVTTLLTNAFGDSFGFSPAIRQLFIPSNGMLRFFGDTGWNNAIGYSSPNYSGLGLNLLTNLRQGAAGATGSNTSFSALYFGGPLTATLAWQQVRNGAFGTPAGWENQQAWQIGGAYDLGSVKLFGQAGRVSTSATVDTHTTLYGLGAKVPVGAGAVLVQYGSASANVPGAADTHNRTMSLGYDYLLSKRTDVYGVVMNDRQSGLSSGNTAAIGLRFKF
ncbi:MAG: porin [Burkholderiales bacterium]|nr:porin [Burkholderiales bacterium]